MTDPKRDPLSIYEQNQRLMQQRPFNKPSKTHSPFADDATVPLPLTREEYKERRRARNKHRYTGGKYPRAHKISLRKYNKLAREQDATPKSEGFGT